MTERTYSPPPATTCDAITINYITHSLPQSCLTSTWASSETPSTKSTGNTDANGTEIDAVSTVSSVESAAPHASSSSERDPRDEPVDGAAKPFMSFEDWKEMMLRETGQDPQDLRARNSNQQRGGDRTPLDMEHAGLGEEDEISLNFDSYLDNNAGDQTEHPSGSNPASGGEHGVGDPVAYDDGRPSTHRSKDAGKTCKERFSYSSFDAGATVLKSGPSAKNAKAILVENKDSYMLLECSARQKFVIVELSDDILIDTIVLANFEFFSSMIRHFRISVSDRYPVKTDHWRDLGTFEARNSRDIQPFLVENPQIWAKYVQIEFLTHYGNEYYCPVSLLRVHGSRMLDSWKETEAGRDEEQPGENEPEPYAEIQSGEAKSTSEQETAEQQPTPDTSITIKHYDCTVVVPIHLFAYPAPTCAASPNHTAAASLRYNHSYSTNLENNDQTPPDPAGGRGTANTHVTKTESLVVEDTPAAPPTTASPSEQLQVASTSSPGISPSLVVDAEANSTVQVTSTRAAPNSDPSSSSTSVAPINKASPPATSGSKNRTSGATGPSIASPPVQEGFFKAITKRLQQVESNLTLSLKYVEDQARHLQETLQRTEQKQIFKVNLFLENLNQTVLAELRNVRDQYDQIWQSTVIALESQREQSQREIVALSSRLNLLADEVVFQKRMAIVQAMLLLSCLVLVIFSRGASLPYLAPFMDQANGPPYDSTASPSAFARARNLHRSTYSGTRDDTVSYNAHQEVDYMPVATVAQNSRSTASSQLREQYSAEEHAALLQCERLSPPQTPNLAHDLSMPDMSVPPRENQPPVLRHLASKQQSNVRKPLPALPENPSSP